jgi:starch phosphorylase
VLPRHLRIIFDINAKFLAAVATTHGQNPELPAPPVADRRIR